MAVTITVADVKDGFDTTVSDAELQMLIDYSNTADECLDANLVPDNTVVLLKKYAVRHMATMQANSGQGTIKSETAPSGAARSFASYKQESGIDGTTYGSLLQQMDSFGCLTVLLQSDTNFDMFSIGGANEQPC